MEDRDNQLTNVRLGKPNKEKDKPKGDWEKWSAQQV